MLDAIAIIWLVFSVIVHWASRGRTIKVSTGGAVVQTVAAVILACAIVGRIIRLERFAVQDRGARGSNQLGLLHRAAGRDDHLRPLELAQVDAVRRHQQIPDGCPAGARL